MAILVGVCVRRRAKRLLLFGALSFRRRPRPNHDPTTTQPRPASSLRFLFPSLALWLALQSLKYKDKKANFFQFTTALLLKIAKILSYKKELNHKYLKYKEFLSKERLWKTRKILAFFNYCFKRNLLFLTLCQPNTIPPSSQRNTSTKPNAVDQRGRPQADEATKYPNATPLRSMYIYTNASE